MLKKGISFFWVLTSLLCFACNTDLYFEKFIHIKQSQWHADSVKQFYVNINDTNSIYQVTLSLRTNSNYSFRNIYFFSNVTLPDSSSIRDTVTFNVADKKGKRFGKGVGVIKRYEVQLSQGKFPYRGRYCFQLQQGMREKVLEGIEGVGLKITKLNEHK